MWNVTNANSCVRLNKNSIIQTKYGQKLFNQGILQHFQQTPTLFLYSGDHRSKDNNVAFKFLVGTKLVHTVCRNQYLEDFKSRKHVFLKLLD